MGFALTLGTLLKFKGFVVFFSLEPVCHIALVLWNWRQEADILLSPEPIAPSAPYSYSSKSSEPPVPTLLLSLADILDTSVIRQF